MGHGVRKDAKYCWGDIDVVAY
jgi:hypothetical protein